MAFRKIRRRSMRRSRVKNVGRSRGRKISRTGRKKIRSRRTRRRTCFGCKSNKKKKDVVEPIKRAQSSVTRSQSPALFENLIEKEETPENLANLLQRMRPGEEINLDLLSNAQIRRLWKCFKFYTRHETQRTGSMFSERLKKTKSSRYSVPLPRGTERILATEIEIQDICGTLFDSFLAKIKQKAAFKERVKNDPVYKALVNSLLREKMDETKTEEQFVKDMETVIRDRRSTISSRTSSTSSGGGVARGRQQTLFEVPKEEEEEKARGFFWRKKIN